MQTSKDADLETLKELAEQLNRCSYEDKLAMIALTSAECDSEALLRSADRYCRTKTLHISANKNLAHLRKALMLMRQLSNAGRIKLMKLITRELSL